MAEATQVGETELARLFYTGRYVEVLQASIDSEQGGAGPLDVAFVIGALSFVGRVVEAEQLLRSVRWHPTADCARTLVAGAAFLSIALGRSGQLRQGGVELVTAERVTRGCRDHWARSLLHQGVACCRFFASDYRGAERAAVNALRNAQAARFSYVRLLANDMRGHLLQRRGRFMEALMELERARQQALVMQLDSNARAMEISSVLIRASLAPVREAAQILELCCAPQGEQDSYSRPALLLELCIRRAWLGDPDGAEALLAQVAAEPAFDDRSQVGVLCARAQLLRVQHGWAAARDTIERAAELAANGADASRKAQVLQLQLGAARACGDGPGERAAVAALRQLAEHAELYQAAAALFIYGDANDFAPAEGDRMTPLLRALVCSELETVLRGELLGLLPETLNRVPGRRLYLLDTALVVEEHGRVQALPGLSPRCRAVLRSIGQGVSSKEGLLDAVWGIRSYAPERHDAVVKTTLSRLRSALGDAASWLQTRDHGYGLTAGVDVVEASGLPVTRLAAARAPADAPLDRKAARRQRLIAALTKMQGGTVGELARELGISVRTASRDLSSLHAEQAVARIGAGPATHYRVISKQQNSEAS